VNKGDLLFQLDCSAEQEVLSACIQARRQREALGQAAAAFALEGQLSLSQLESQARAGIAASQIRAEADGVVENVYAQAGSYVQQGELLGWMRGTELCVQSSGDTERLAMVRAGAAAVLSTGEAVQLQSMGAPTAENQQQLVFIPLKEDGLTERRVGETVTIEMLSGPVCNAALVPLAAVSANGEIWFVENGRARSETVDVSRRNADYVAVSAEWLGRSVVLAPDEAQLKQGCAVKEAGRK